MSEDEKSRNEIEMIAEKNFRGSYAEGFVRRGDRFMTTPRRARLHEKAGRARRAEEEPAEEDEKGKTGPDETEPGPSETKPDGPSEEKSSAETKGDESADMEEELSAGESGSEDQPAPVRSYEKSGSWKTLYEDGEEVAKVQAPEKEVEMWRRHERELDDLK